MWEDAHHAVPGRDRPIEPWDTETGAERGSSRPGLPTPGQVCGAMEPVGARSGTQECVGVTYHVVSALMWRKPSGIVPCVPLGSAGRSPEGPAE